MFHLLPLMLERAGIILIVAFLLSHIKSFRRIIHTDNQRISEKALLIVIFGSFGVISNYTGIEIHHNTIAENAWLINVEPDSAIANTRIMGIAIGSLLGGPIVGLGIGIIAGLHRFMLGGFTAAACAISAVVAGVAAGYIGKRRKQKSSITPWFAVSIGVVMEIIQMVIILLVTKPYGLAWDLVKLIGVPMIVINGFGTFLFMLIIRSILREEERTKALQTNTAFHIADQTLPYFRQGLNPESCKEVAQIMLRLTHADAIAITNDRQVLAHVGAASDHHVPMQRFSTGLTKKVLEQGRVITAKSKEEILCYNQSCPLLAAVVLPLQVHQNTVGTLKLYFTNPGHLNEVEKELAEGLANLFSTQLELAEAENQSKLLKNAEIKALQAQVHPHFLFNAINTISALCRTDAEKARKLLLELSHFFRSNLQGARQTLIPLEKELEHVKAYLSLEQARFPNKYQATFSIEPGLENSMLPPFILQPLVENAVRHGFSGVKSKCEISITAFSDEKKTNITVKDNGKGISPEKLDSLGKQEVLSKQGSGTALVNIRERLEGIYNTEAHFAIKSMEGSGTEVTVIIPLDRKGAYEEHVEGIFSR
ncbi:sensor histidine kinase [Peribacillus cavernae]|uniref:histidine kinase n=1 Tax=Peribacillus cavernae TaxID=1674310 RepID=A0A433HTG6_9BACI|nr:sensor histidine kinase [Peribacillus cavernae]MDQ0218626.1 two-component system sensor histidine kinase LytS [Peribacillus cavernae]RUQ31609.1 sensor histidine kinase [Peribacillus cavernae]